MCLTIEWTPANMEAGLMVSCKKQITSIGRYCDQPASSGWYTGYARKPIASHGWLLRASADWEYLYEGRSLTTEGVHAYALPGPKRSLFSNAKLVDALAIGVLAWGRQNVFNGGYIDLCSLAMLVKLPDNSNRAMWNRTKAILRKPLAKRVQCLRSVLPFECFKVLDEYEQIDW